MALAKPPIDPRHFQDIVDEAKKRIPSYFDGWSDHNVSDPGITFIELFAWMTEMILYQTNQMPDRHYLQMMELFGIKRRGTQPATANITFWLSQAPLTSLTIPAGTEVATTQTETQPSVIFTTVEPLHITPPQLHKVMSATQTDDKQRFQDHTSGITTGWSSSKYVPLFSETPKPTDAFYIGFSNDVSNHLVRFNLDCKNASGAGARKGQQAYLWQAAVAPDGWETCQVDSDQTDNFNQPGIMQIHVPEMTKRSINGQEAYWLRVQPRPAAGQPQEFTNSPTIKSITTESWGGTVTATHGEKHGRELLGYSEGSPGQRFALQRTPILKPLLENERLEVVMPNGNQETWQYRDNFYDSRVNSKHFTLDAITGEVRLGPAIQQHEREDVLQSPKSTERHFGAIPPRKAALYFSSYRVGGGRVGNVQAYALNTLKTSIPYVDKVANLRRATGGKEAETLAEMMFRAPQALNARQRAVTAKDFEHLAKEALGSDVARVHCFQPLPLDTGRVRARVGEVHLLAVPNVPEELKNGRLSPPMLTLANSQKDAIKNHLDQFRLLTVRLAVREPHYHWVAVRVTIRPNPGYRPARVRARVNERLTQFLSPISGWTTTKGWPFGRDLYDADIYLALRDLPELLAVRDVELYKANPTSGQPTGDPPLKRISVYNNGIIASGLHDVQFDTA